MAFIDERRSLILLLLGDVNLPMKSMGGIRQSTCSHLLYFVFHANQDSRQDVLFVAGV